MTPAGCDNSSSVRQRSPIAAATYIQNIVVFAQSKVGDSLELQGYKFVISIRLTDIGTIVSRSHRARETTQFVFAHDDADLAIRRRNMRRHLKTGEGHAGWILRSVKAREVTLEKERQTETLRLPAPGENRPGVQKKDDVL